MISRLHISFFLFLFSVSAFPQSIESRLEKSTMLIGEQVNVEVKVTVLNGDTFTPPLWSDTLHTNLEIIAEKELDTIVGQNESTYRSRLTLTCFDTGVYALPPLLTKVAGTPFLSNPHLLTVNSPEVDTTEAVRDIKDPMEVPYTFRELLEISAKYIGIAWFAFAIIALLAYFFGKSKKKTQEIIPEPEIPLDQWIEDALQALEEKSLWQNGAYKEYHIELSDITRTYLERKHSINAHELTTFDLEKVIKASSIPSDLSADLIQAMRISDLAKFAKAEPLATENDFALQALKKLIIEDQRKAEELAESRKEGDDVG